MLSRSESSLLYLGGRQLVAALSLGPLWVAVDQHPLELKLKRDVSVTARYNTMHSLSKVTLTTNLELLLHGAVSSLLFWINSLYGLLSLMFHQCYFLQGLTFSFFPLEPSWAALLWQQHFRIIAELSTHINLFVHREHHFSDRACM